RPAARSRPRGGRSPRSRAAAAPGPTSRRRPGPPSPRPDSRAAREQPGNENSQKHVTLSLVTSQQGVLGSVHDAARRTADMLAILLPPAGRGPGQRAALIAVLRA